MTDAQAIAFIAQTGRQRVSEVQTLFNLAQ